MYNIKIRQATNSESDLNGIVHIHRDGGDAWDNIRTCTAWITKRLERGFYIRIAEIDGKIAGHAEWIITDEPDGNFLYLGMLQIDEDYQKQGIGRAMVSDGIEYAKKNNCTSVVTSPDTETGAAIFYRKCGFIDGRKQHTLKILTEKYKNFEFEKNSISKVPFSVLKEKKFIFGKDCQFSPRHMWEVMNEPPSTDTKRRTPAILLSDGTYIQLHIWGESDSGGVYIWTNSTNYTDIIKSALSFGYSLGLRHLDFGHFEDEESFFDGFEVHEKRASGEFEQIYYINMPYKNLRHVKIDLGKDKDYILECHCRINYECDTPWARKIPYEEYRANWFNNIGQQNGFLSMLADSMKDERTVAEIIKTESNETVGYLFVSFYAETESFMCWADVQDIYIEEPYRKSGVATYLMDYAEKSAKQNGAKVIRSGTGCENVKSQGLHEKMGYYQYRFEYEKVLNVSEEDKLI